MTSILKQIVAFIQQLIEEIRMNFFSPINTPEARLQRLRWLYVTDPALDMTYRRARDVLRGYVNEQYYDYYHRFLAAERLAQRQLNQLHQGARGDELFQQMQELGAKIVNLIEQIQQFDKTMALYPANSPERQQITESRTALLARIEAALNAQAKIPVKMLTLATTADTGSFGRLNESIDRLTNRLEDIASSYDDVRKYGDLDEAIRHLEDSDGMV